jgi:5-(aminomethyl)-3-furanmethanol phosphate kinase
MNDQHRDARIVVKVGGSLYDFPALALHLSRFLDGLAPAQIALFPGGGSLVDVVRQLDRCHGLGEERSHWLAVRSLSLAAYVLTHLLAPRCSVVSTLGDCQAAWAFGQIAVIDPDRFARADARRKDALPRTWDVTSDSLALQVARRWRASRLILLKSTTAPPDWPATRVSGIVDPWFERLLAETGEEVEVSIVNLRQQMKS